MEAGMGTHPSSFHDGAFKLAVRLPDGKPLGHVQPDGREGPFKHRADFLEAAFLTNPADWVLAVL